MIKITDIINEVNNKYKVYCDLDGVVANFDWKFMSISNGITCDDYVEKYGYEKFWKLIHSHGVNFWESIPLMRDANKLWGVIKRFNPIVLTAIPDRDAEIPTKGKITWIKKNLGGNVPYIICLRSEKQKYVSENSILIDDLPKNIEEWEAAGGIGILHKNANSTIAQLKKLKVTI